MSRRSLLARMSVAALLALPSASLAKPPRARAHPVFDPSTVVTVRGEIAKVERIPRGRRYEGVHIMVATGTETLDVHLGPSRFVGKQTLKLAKGERVEVTESRVTLGGKPALVAQEVRSGDSRMVLRNAAGVPAWSRARAALTRAST